MGFTAAEYVQLTCTTPTMHASGNLGIRYQLQHTHAFTIRLFSLSEPRKQHALLSLGVAVSRAPFAGHYIHIV